MTLSDFISEWNNSSDTVLVHTSGSTGAPKPMWVEKRRMEASARITCDFLGLKPGNTALLCLPLDYIAGKMMVVRALTCNLRLISIEPTGHPCLTMPDNIDFAAMTPMQVHNSLQTPEERRKLASIRHLIIGGGAISDNMAAQLRDFDNNIWSTYGMTETLSHIALRRISGSGATDWYTPFSSVQVSLNGDGCLVIDAPNVCANTLVTNDIAEIVDGRFRILGRRDNVICSGGIKIQIEEVERELAKHTDIPLIITKFPDERLGETVVLLTESSDIDELRRICNTALPRYWQPRHYLIVSKLPTTATGKPARAEAQRLCEEMLKDVL